jgi:hypothetical protein
MKDGREEERAVTLAKLARMSLEELLYYMLIELRRTAPRSAGA